MRGRVALLLAFGLGMAECGVRPASVSQTTTETHNRDSVTVKTELKKDSSSYVEKEIINVIPASHVGFTMSKASFDSLIVALKAMPAGVPRSITKDFGNAKIAVSLDSANNLNFDCLSAAQALIEKHTVMVHVIEDYKKETATLHEENRLLRAEVFELKKSFFERLKEGFNSWIVRILLAFIAMGIVVVIYDVGKAQIKKLWAQKKLL
jgi:hypothetical protein